MRSRAVRLAFGFLAVAALPVATASPLHGQTPLTVHQQLRRLHDEAIANATPARPGTIRNAASPRRTDFGVVDPTAVAVQAYAFQAATSTDLLVDDGNGYRYFGAAPSNPYLAAPVQIPSGVVIDGFGLSYCDDAAGDLVVALLDNGDAGSANVTIASFSTVVAGCNSQTTANGEVSYRYESNVGHPLYVVMFWASGKTDGSVKFNSAEVSYHRIVSDPPPAATFNDVPTNHPFFQYVEALAASGITGGCQVSPPLYCPDNPVTRGQMAVFLAKALGLHWNN